MFQNSGKKIMGLVKFVFYANAVIIALAVIGAAIWMMVEEGFGPGLGVLLGGAIAAVVYLAIVYLSLLCMFAFGEMVQANIEQRDILRRMAGSGAAMGARPATPVPPVSNPVPPVRTAPPVSNPVPPVRTAPPVSNPVPPVRTAPAAPERPMGYPASPAAPAPAAVAGDRSAVCPHCGARQSASNNNCKYCGTPMRG